MRKGRERWRYKKQGWEGKIRPFLNFGLPDSLYFPYSTSYHCLPLHCFCTSNTRSYFCAPAPPWSIQFSLPREGERVFDTARLISAEAKVKISLQMPLSLLTHYTSQKSPIWKCLWKQRKGRQRPL